jgi:hypothetical protein
MRCNTCEGRSIKDLFVNKSKNVSARRLSRSGNKLAQMWETHDKKIVVFV